MENVIVTGASGFLGTWLVERLMKGGHKVCAVVRNGAAGASRLAEQGVVVVHNDMADLALLHKRIPSWFHADTFYHLAWSGTSGKLRSDYALQLKNVQYTCDAVHAACRAGCRRFVGAGSLAELDCMEYSPLDGASPSAVSNYAAAKIAAEYMSKAECNRLGMEYVWGIFSNIYGAGNRTGNFVNYAADLLLNRKRAAFTEGLQNYDFVYITDFTEGLYLLGRSGRKNCSYFIGSGRPQTMREYIYQIRDAIDPSAELYFGEVPFYGVSLPKEKLSICKLTADTGYEPSVSFEEGIKITVDWMRRGMTGYETNE